MKPHPWLHTLAHLIRHVAESEHGKKIARHITDKARSTGIPAVVAAAIPVAAVAAVGYALHAYFNEEGGSGH